MSTQLDYQVFHKYMYLVKDGHAKELTCRHDGYPLTLVLGPDDGPALRCFMCQTLTLPGLDMYAQIRAVVTEWFME